MATMTTTYDEKIMKFDITEGYDAFMKLFNEAEIAEMRRWLEHDHDWLFDDANNEQELRDGVVFAYVKEWLCENIRNEDIDGTEQLFNIIYKM
jgi:hypothetical protein